MENNGFKLPLPDSFAWLCGFIGTLHTCLGILASGKQEVSEAVQFTIPATGWGTDSSVPQYPYYNDFSVAGLLATDIVDVNVAPGSAWAASAAEFTSTESSDGKFRLRCKNAPTEAITAQYHITNTANYAE